jgi:ribosomal protein S18 acetylase RimI-like enzyme
MGPHPLDNPIWSALGTCHARFALGAAGARRYVPAVAPFAAVAGGTPAEGRALAALVSPGERIYMLGVAPPSAAAWRIEASFTLAQMICTAPLEEVDGPPVVELGDAHRADMLELTALVYPEYFRPRTPEMGRYLGIYAGGRLAAMAGERMFAGDFREISAVCTHPEHLGQGYARRLMAELCNDCLRRGLTPFLHVSRENRRAKALYDRIGFVDRCDIAYRALNRV